MNLLRLESRLDGAVAYLARLKAAMTRADAELWPRAELSQDLESLMTQLNQIPGRVQEWKKSFARYGADVALSLVRVHCKEAKEENLVALKVANTKKHTFQSFMDTFLEASAIQPLLLPPSDRQKGLCFTLIFLRMPSGTVIVKTPLGLTSKYFEFAVRNLWIYMNLAYLRICCVYTPDAAPDDKP